jgi:hypothetical protein
MFKWKLIFMGIGLVAGVASSSLFSKRPAIVRDTATTVISYGLSAKRKIDRVAALAKENIGDLVAESDQKAQERQPKDIK